MEKKLNIGSGMYPKEGFVNVDYRADVGAQVVHDLNSFPYPFENASFSHIEADHLLEHLQQPFAVMRELHRILTPGGTVVIRVPHFSRGFAHPEHEHGFDVSFPLYFDPEFKGGYEGVHFICERIHMQWFAQWYLKRETLSPISYAVGRTLDVPLTFLANLSPYACARIWCFWFGGFEQVEFRLKKPISS